MADANKLLEQATKLRAEADELAAKAQLKYSQAIDADRKAAELQAGDKRRVLERALNTLSEVRESDFGEGHLKNVRSWLREEIDLLPVES